MNRKSIIKSKFLAGAAIAGMIAVTVGVGVMAVQADTTPLAVTCSGSVSGNQVTWTATPSGGNAPYSLLWSGDPSVANSTSSLMTITYGTNGTYNAGIQATDASSSVATSNCSATVTSNVTPATTSTLNVYLNTNNSAGGSSTPSNFTVNLTGASATPSSFNGSSSATPVVVNGGATYGISVSSVANYEESLNGNCAGPIAAGDSDSCTITETYVPTVTAATTGTLYVYVNTNNSAGGSASPSSFVIDMSGANATPSSFNGASTGTAVAVSGGSAYSISASSVANYEQSLSGNCGGPITAGQSGSCTVTETYVPTGTTTPPTPTSTLPRVNPPQLTIGPNGSFLSRGMTVTSVASGSFQAEVWGITYTINWSGNGNGGGNSYPYFYYRGGNGGGAMNPTTEIAVGDEVSVSGSVTTSNPLVVNANTVRDWSITQSRPTPPPPAPPYQGNGNGNGYGYGNGYGNGNGNNNGGGNNNGNGNGNGGGSNGGFSSELQSLVSELDSLRGVFNSRFGR